MKMAKLTCRCIGKNRDQRGNITEFLLDDK